MPSKSCFSCATSCFARKQVLIVTKGLATHVACDNVGKCFALRLTTLVKQVQKNHIKRETGTQPSFATFGQVQITCTVTSKI